MLVVLFLIFLNTVILTVLELINNEATMKPHASQRSYYKDIQNKELPCQMLVKSDGTQVSNLSMSVLVFVRESLECCSQMLQSRCLLLS